MAASLDGISSLEIAQFSKTMVNVHGDFIVPSVVTSAVSSNKQIASPTQM